MHRSISPSGYNPNKLFDTLISRMSLHNDASLARLLEVQPVALSKMREHRAPVGAALLLRMGEVTGLNVRELRNLMDDHRTRYQSNTMPATASGRPSAVIAISPPQHTQETISS